MKTLFSDFFPTTHKRRFTTHTVQECLYIILESQRVNLKYITVIGTLLSTRNALFS